MQEILYSHNHQDLTYLGRFLRLQDSTTCNYSASGVQFSCTAKRVEIEMTTKGELWYNMPLTAWFHVSISGEVTKEFYLELKNGTAWYTLFDSLEEKKINVVIRKCTEAKYANSAVSKLKINGSSLTKLPLNKKHKFSFFGDSLTCGYGILGMVGGQIANPTQENALDAYSAKLSEIFDADMETVCVSGIGVYSNATFVDMIDDERLMKHIFPYSDYFSELSLYGHARTKWDFSFESDLVIIFLGANDSSYLYFENEAKNRAFIEAYIEFIKQVRVHYNAPILCAICENYGKVPSLIDNAIMAYKHDSRDEQIRLVTVSKPRPEDGMGPLEHPLAVTHARWANEIAAELEKWLGFEKQ